VRSDIPITVTGNSGFKNISYDKSTSNLSVEFWVQSSELAQNFDLHFILPKGVTATVVDNHNLPGWTLLSNVIGNEFAVAAIGSAPLGAGQSLQLVTITFSGVDDSHVPFLKSGVVGSQVVSSEELYQNVNAFSDGGSTNFLAPDGTYSAEDIYINHSEIERAIDSRDALLALKIANGSVVVSDLGSPLQILAADINQNGAVTTLDAWLLLRDIVGIEHKNIGKVGLVEQGTDLSGLSAANAHLDLINEFSINSDTPFNATAFVVGDVNGSYVII
jgi:hypothetical protein